jgi:hypothetical protein
LGAQQQPQRQPPAKTMPLILIAAGIVLIITGIKGNPSSLWGLVQGDFTGANNYVYWMVSILVLGALGYIPQLKNVSRLFLLLVIVVLLIHNQGFFAQLQAFINSGSSVTAASASGAAATTPQPNTVTGGGA